ncbi:hypothetical protein L6164_017073 [Bauhinia variegata]|uniref:Uncharacterized protein n=1 Tax=Bauhinia variegata TaxID=167791 RepID=A0ACB9N6P0_BAUVA|nr:hypothetical protein L6164_017073 [Bauhinia variegata]
MTTPPSKLSTSRLREFSTIRRNLMLEYSPEKPRKFPRIEIPSGEISTSGCETPPSKKLLNCIEDCWEEFLAEKRKISNSSEAMEAERARKIQILMCVHLSETKFQFPSLIFRISYWKYTKDGAFEILAKRTTVFAKTTRADLQSYAEARSSSFLRHIMLDLVLLQPW